MLPDYDKSALLQAYKSVGLAKGRVVYLTGNIGALGRFENKAKDKLLEAHFEVILDLIGGEGTLVVPTHTWSLCNSDKIFDIAATPSETGVLSEFVRCREGSVRQFHPFSSSTAYGKLSELICTRNSLHAYGPNSPCARIIDADAIHVSFGLPINKTISMVHHVELVMGVPYRYTKEFVHPCLVDGKVRLKEFYLYVTRQDVDITRDRNKRILDFYAVKNEIKTAQLGRSSVQSLEKKKLFDSTVDLFSRDIYAWLSYPPLNRESYRL